MEDQCRTVAEEAIAAGVVAATSSRLLELLAVELPVVQLRTCRQRSASRWDVLSQVWVMRLVSGSPCPFLSSQVAVSQ